MITEFAIAAGIVYGFRYIQNTSCRKLSREFDKVVFNASLNNKSGENFQLKKIEKTDYGYTALISIPRGKDIEKLESAKLAIETRLKAVVEIEKDKFEDYGRIKIVTNPLNTKDYVPVKARSNQLFLGYHLDGKSYIIDLNKDPQILIAGKTGTGKSFELATILTNAIYFNKKNIEIYLLQVMKGEIDIFKNCPSVKFTSDNKEEILTILKKLTETIHKRSKLFTQHGIKNITQWNNHFPKNKMKRIIIGAEEISFFMKKDDKDNNPYFEYFWDIVKAGRSVGMHFIGLTQRTTAANLGGNGELKSQFTVITAKQRSELDSMNAIDIKDAVYLREQEFIASANDGHVTFKAPRVDEDYKILNKYVPEIRIPNEPVKVEDKKKVYSCTLSYEESQKLKSHSEFYVLEKETQKEEPKTDITEQPKAEIVELQRVEKKKKSTNRRPGAKKKEVKEVAMDNERNGLQNPNMD